MITIFKKRPVIASQILTKQHFPNFCPRNKLTARSQHESHLGPQLDAMLADMHKVSETHPKAEPTCRALHCNAYVKSKDLKS